MDLAVAGVGGSVLKLIFSLVLSIRAKAKTARQNKEDCLRIARRASTLQHALADQQLAYKLQAASMRYPAVTSVLEDLRLALRQALVAVTGCQRDRYGGALSRLLNASKVSAELRQVNKDIKDRIMDVVLVTSLYTNSLVYITHRHHMEERLQIQQVYGYAHNRSIQASPSIPDQRTSGEIESRAAAASHEEVVAFRREARQSNIEPRLVLLLILFLLLLGTRCGLERLLIMYLWRFLFRLG